jgi:hypothetical protein
MARVTTIVQVDNLSSYDIYLEDGEDKDKNITCHANLIHKCSIRIPWIGNKSENYKKITLKCGKYKDNYIYIFQDYWNSSDAVKFSKVRPFDYNDGNHDQMQYDPTGAGDKYLQIMDVYDSKHENIIDQIAYLRRFDT